MTPVNGITSALQQIQTMATQATAGVESPQQMSGAATVGGFAQALKSSIDKISDNQVKAADESKAFELGAANVSLNDVMIDMQKANVGFQFGLQVRNKLVSAYNDIMQTQV